jgi:hypothetical protein
VSLWGYGRASCSLAFRWDDVDLERGVLHVRQNVQRLPEMGRAADPGPAGPHGWTVAIHTIGLEPTRWHPGRAGSSLDS